jgi:carboxylesterase
MSQYYGAPEHQPYTLGQSRQRAILVHGFPGTPAETRALAEHLAARGWQAHGVLLPGFGPQITQLADTSHRQWIAAVAESLRQVQAGAEQCTLIGFSMGGALAILASLAAPPDQLILISPFTRLPDWRAQFLPLLKYFIPTLRPFAQADFSDASVIAELQKIAPELDFRDPNVQQRVRQEVVLKTKTLDELRKVGAKAYAAAPKHSAPTVIIQGAQDTTVLPTYSQRLARRLPHARYFEVPGAHDFIFPGRVGHAALLEALDEVV